VQFVPALCRNKHIEKLTSPVLYIKPRLAHQYLDCQHYSRYLDNLSGRTRYSMQPISMYMACGGSKCMHALSRPTPDRFVMVKQYARLYYTFSLHIPISISPSSPCPTFCGVCPVPMMKSHCHCTAGCQLGSIASPTALISLSAQPL
jgi:hypothetical protein